jgi:hypothetical protein
MTYRCGERSPDAVHLRVRVGVERREEGVGGTGGAHPPVVNGRAIGEDRYAVQQKQARTNSLRCTRAIRHSRQSTLFTHSFCFRTSVVVAEPSGTTSIRERRSCANCGIYLHNCVPHNFSKHAAACDLHQTGCNED